MIHNSILEAIGNTPLVKLHNVTGDLPLTVAAKVEYLNPGQSIKDRIALQMIEDAEEKGLIKPGGTIIEGTSGNTGMGLALAAAVKGYNCIFTTTDKQSQEKIDLLRALGAEVRVCPTNVEPDDPQSYYSVAKRLIINHMKLNSVIKKLEIEPVCQLIPQKTLLIDSVQRPFNSNFVGVQFSYPSIIDNHILIYVNIIKERLNSKGLLLVLKKDHSYSVLFRKEVWKS